MLWVARGRRSRETRRAILTTTAVVLTVALSVTALYAAAVGVLYAQRIYPGVSALGMDLGGRTVGDASRLVSGRLDRYGGQRITVRAAGFQTTIAASDLGFRPRTAALVRASYQVGRASPLELGLLTEAVGGRTSPSLAPDWDVDPTAVDRAVAAIAARVDRSPVEPTIAIGPTATFQPGRDGQTLDRIGARVAIERYLAGLTSGPLDLPVAVGHPTVSDQQVRDLADLASAILAQPASVTDGGQTWAIPSDTVRAALSYTPSPPGLDLDPAKLSAALQPIAAPLNRPPHDAALVVAGGKVQVVPERAGQRVDLAASAAALRAGLLAGQHTVGLVVTTTSPRIHAADLSAVAAQARQWLVEDWS